MTPLYTLYGWHLSYFTGKALCYLRYKQANFRLKPVNLFTLMVTIKKKTGAAVMPVLKSNTGEWIQDTSIIIDRFEQEIPSNPVVPEDPVQRFASYLLEAWGDEWWIPIAMHTRWNHAENYTLFEHDAGKALLPFAPKFLQNKAAAKPARFLKSMLPGVGITPSQYNTMNRWTVHMLDALDTHFAQHAFLLGQRPSLGDFGLVGTMYGHLGRDPWPKRELIDPRPNLKAWLARMTNPAPHAQGELFAPGSMPATLNPVWHSVLHEFVPMVQKTGDLLCQLAQQRGLNTRLPRSVGMVETRMGDMPFKRMGLGYTVWMMQRALDCYRAMPRDEQTTVEEWLAQHHARDLLNMDLPRVERIALTVAVTALPSTMEQAA
ncbi:MAG TPA: glutathione S-transferase family protein [Limnobacter sp.]|nr:glutathione S-transferase family protein [Limnobacter sp.]